MGQTYHIFADRTQIRRSQGTDKGWRKMELKEMVILVMKEMVFVFMKKVVGGRKKRAKGARTQYLANLPS